MKVPLVVLRGAARFRSRINLQVTHLSGNHMRIFCLEAQELVGQATMRSVVKVNSYEAGEGNRENGATGRAMRA